MKLLLLAIVMTMSSGNARGDCFGIYSSPEQYGCFLTLVEPPNYNSVYIFHKVNPGSIASQFKVLDNSGLFFANASFNLSFLVLGTYNTDLSISYTQCLFGDVLVGTLNYFWFGNPITGCDSWLSIVAAPTSPIPGSIAVADCATPRGLRTGYSGWPFHFGADAGSCEFDCGCEHHETPIAASTWGAVKALYR